MLEFVLKQDGKKLMSRSIDSNPIAIGRGNNNSVKLLDDEISRNHCRIEWKSDSLYVTDLSSNGTLLNGKPIKEAELHAGDTLTIGTWSIEITTSADAIAVKTVGAAILPTSIIELNVGKKSIVSEKMELIICSPDQTTMRRRISASEFTIGHHASCDISVADPYTSRRHCRIVNDGNGLKLIDLASTNGTFFGGTKIEQMRIPKQGSFQIGQTSISYRVERTMERIGVSKESSIGNMIGPSREMREVFALMNKVGASNATICITGESGTGKEVAARALHEISPRNKGPFIAINCGAIPANIIESHLFGHERGSFTGAVDRAAGLIEQAGGGTLFLDEIGEMPLELQTRLLRVLESRTLRRLGGKREISVDFRLICATNKDLKKMAWDGRFREDLFFRIFVLPIELPALKGREEDISALAKHFIEELQPKGRQFVMTEDATKKLTSHSWPGNVRELKNSIERTLLLSEGDIIDADDLKLIFHVEQQPKGGLKDREKGILVETLVDCNGNITRAAKKLNIARTTLQKKIKTFSIEVPGRA
jgi:DNA-binding NtrC family response regulator